MQLEKCGRVAVVWLNRPERLNAISRLMLDEIASTLRALAQDDATRVIVLAGRGVSFSSGFDVERGGAGFGWAPDPVSDAIDLERRLGRFLEVWDSPKPVVAAVHGHCLAAATILCTLADVTIVASDARIGYSTMPLGGGFIEPLWVHLVGPKRAKQMALIPGHTISGATAVDWGWANFAVEPDRLFGEALEVATRMARMPPDVARLRKQAINRMVELAGLREGALMGAQTDALLHRSPAVQRLRAAIDEHGLKEAIRRFQAGELET
ncbi:enoyl-CoA hydratase-related protein [Ramlibacter pinisoli]|uniref:enoyl-CoA hydratase-related protein n=1 Tax=Ramlibacter sp. CGMCC 1.13660 TaxID=2755558 RepID=UPI0012F94670|nr:enoyl-CoA hydratase-related protein [Ramlibacter sp. CGMCC 1.13660]